MAEWIDGLTEDDIVSQLSQGEREVLALLQAMGDSIESITDEEWLSLGGGGPFPDDFRSRFKRELYLLVCTDDPKYAELRQKLREEGPLARTVVVALIAAAIGATLGMTAALLAALVALHLIALAQMGKEAWCAWMREQCCQGDPGTPE